MEIPTSTLLFAFLVLFFALVAVYAVVRLQSEEERREALDNEFYHHLCETDLLKAQYRDQRQALLFYANEENWTPQKREGYPFLTASPIAKDQGQKARGQFPEFQWSE